MASTLLPYHASFTSPSSRTGTHLQSFLYEEAHKLLRQAFPRLQPGYLRRHLRAPGVECVMLLASSSAAAPSPARATGSQKDKTIVGRARCDGEAGGDDSDPLEVLDENSDDQVLDFCFEKRRHLCPRPPPPP